jgi:hypothetical protein
MRRLSQRQKVNKSYEKMRWFFLGFILLMAALVNLAVITNDPFSKFPEVAAFNIALAGILLIWYGAYFQADIINARCRGSGVALLDIAAGVFILQAGVDAVMKNSCAGFLSSQPYSLRNDIVSFFQGHGYCAEIGYVTALAGIFLVYVGVKLFLRVNRRVH